MKDKQPDNTTVVSDEKKIEIREIAITDLRPNPYQPRQVFEPDKLAELAASIRETGIIQPLVVREKDGFYEIVAGERRWRAAKAAGLARVPVIVRTYTDSRMQEAALVENIQRSDLDPIEEAKGIRAMMDNLQLTQEEAAKKLGKSRTAVTNALRLLALPPEVTRLVTEKKLPAGLARPLLGLKDKKTMVKLARMAVKGGWSARIMEKVVDGEKKGTPYHIYMEQEKDLLPPAKQDGTPETKIKKQEPLDPDTARFQEQLIEYLGTKVRIEPGPKGLGGRILIEYYSEEDLARVYELLKKPRTLAISKKIRKFTV